MHQNQIITLGLIAKARRKLGQVEDMILAGDPPNLIWKALYGIMPPEAFINLTAYTWDEVSCKNFGE